MELKHLINNLNDQLGEPFEGNETLTIIIPCYNEERNILQLYTGLSRHLHEMGVTYMLWFIDDGSTDHTLDVIKELAENNVHIKFVSFSRNFGHQKALKAGLDRANGKALIMMDAETLQQQRQRLHRNSRQQSIIVVNLHMLEHVASLIPVNNNSSLKQLNP